MWMLALLLAPLATAQDWSEESCPTTASAQFKYVRGEATGKTEAEALSAALDAALERAKPDVCEGSVESPRCAARMAHVVQYGGDTDKQGGQYQACRSVAIDWDKLNPLDEVVETWLKDLDTLAASAKETVGDSTTLYIDGPSGPGDCTLGGWSTHLERRVAAGLGLVSDAPKDSAGVLRLRITESGSEAVLAADVRRPDWDGDTFKALEPVTWPSALFVAGHEDICGNKTDAIADGGRSSHGLAARAALDHDCGACGADKLGNLPRHIREAVFGPGKAYRHVAEHRQAGIPKRLGATNGPACPAPERVKQTCRWCRGEPGYDSAFQIRLTGDTRAEPRCESGRAVYSLCDKACEDGNLCWVPIEQAQDGCWNDLTHAPNGKGQIGGGIVKCSGSMEVFYNAYDWHCAE
ncbi:MAG: hypothetical protein EP330_07275 [Deltaproteobacteria bacterium]|nr:MAG: hypothetical protein EP330_07275 [Deltaproteobacteria bacterium]